MTEKRYTLEQMDEGRPFIARAPDGDVFIKIGDIAITMDVDEFLEFTADCRKVALILALEK